MRRGDKLWQHTCFEIFISPRMPAYREFNFSPSGEWASYAFAGYREAQPAPEIPEPSLSIRSAVDGLALDAMIPLANEGSLSIALAAIVESKPGALSYWALRHPPGKPDFHHSDGFVLELDEARN